MRPSLPPLAHRAALDALEAQRAAYQRYARQVEAQRHSLGDGDADRAVAATELVERGFAELEAGARRLGALVTSARALAGQDELAALERTIDELAREARRAETAISNLAAQFEAWRDAYGRQLTELGVTPAAGGAGDDRAGAGGYGPRGAGQQRTPGAIPSLIDRRG
jgi:hypothetical protein